MYSGYITTLKDVRPHSNADRLQLATVFGNQIIVSLESKEGDLGVYFPTDGRLGLEYAQANNLLRKKDELGNDIGGYLDPDKRHIRSLKLRGEFSDGLFMPLSSLADFTDISKLQIGDIVKEYNGVTICEKYVPFQRAPRANSGQGPSKKKKSQFVQFAEHADTKQLAYCLGEFKEGDLCYITGKLHGTSGRTTYTIQERETPMNWIQRLFKRKPIITREYATATGTRRVVLDFSKPDTGFYNTSGFRKKYHDFIVPKLYKGETIYYEIVGYTGKDQPIMPICDNKKVNDKAFVKQYGERTTFSYGCANGESDIYAYRMTMTNEDGFVMEYPHELVKIRCEQMGIKVVPELDKFIYTTQEDLLARVAKYEDGPDFIDPTHIREGIIVRIERGDKFKALKSKNIYFKVIEGIIKEEALEPDMEEAEGEQ